MHDIASDWPKEEACCCKFETWVWVAIVFSSVGGLSHFGTFCCTWACTSGIMMSSSCFFVTCFTYCKQWGFICFTFLLIKSGSSIENVVVDVSVVFVSSSDFQYASAAFFLISALYMTDIRIKLKKAELPVRLHLTSSESTFSTDSQLLR